MTMQGLAFILPDFTAANMASMLLPLPEISMPRFSTTR
jgi:hypothetical protein